MSGCGIWRPGGAPRRLCQIEWWGLALLALVLFLVMNLRKSPGMNAATTVPTARAALWLLVLLFFAPLLGASGCLRLAVAAGRTDQPRRADPAGARAAGARTEGRRYGHAPAVRRQIVAGLRRRRALRGGLPPRPAASDETARLALGRQRARVQQVLLAASGCCDRAYLDRASPGCG